jgi:predicted RNase H-like HicB family nuclease
MNKLTYLAVCEPDGENGFGIYFPDLPGCVSYGSDIEEAKKNAKEALELHIYGMQEDGEILPNPQQCITDTKEGDCILAITVFPELVKNELDNRRVKTNCTIPAYLKKEAEKEGINFSQLLECALKNLLSGSHTHSLKLG